jgi:hypothetical protein
MVLVDRSDHRIHLGRKYHIKKNYRIDPIMKILKYSYLNLNTCKKVQLFWAMVIMDIGLQYLPYTKGINWIGIIEFEIG